MEFYKALFRPLLFHLFQDAESARDNVGKLLQFNLPWKVIHSWAEVEEPKLNVSIGNLQFPNPVGLAAGFDKDCKYITKGLRHLGFGYVTGGTILAREYPGNDKPRLFRDEGKNALINAMGYPSEGVEAVALRLTRQRNLKSPLILSISGKKIDEFLEVHAKVEPLCDAVEVNISSPNTPEMADFRQPEKFSELLDKINDQKNKPVFVKLPPYHHGDNESKEKVLEIVRQCLVHDVDAVTAVNTILYKDSRLGIGEGGLSGKPLFPLMLQVIKDIYSETDGKLPINACGGIFTAEDAWQAIQAGATTVQLLTGFIFEGPFVAKKINTGLIKILDEHGIDSLRDIHVAHDSVSPKRSNRDKVPITSTRAVSH